MRAISAVTFGSAATARHKTSALFVHKSEWKPLCPPDDDMWMWQLHIIASDLLLLMEISKNQMKYFIFDCLLLIGMSNQVSVCSGGGGSVTVLQWGQSTEE